VNDRAACRVCGADCGCPALDLSAPALTTTNANLDAPTRAFVCSSCGHVQSPDLPDLAGYYDTQYRASLESEEHDQLYEMRGETPIFRTDRQAEVVLDKAKLAEGARVLDYGAAKAQTLQKVWARRPDIVPHVFDVSEDYRPFWSRWLTPEAAACYAVPEPWRGRFDLVTAHYVMEHVQGPVDTLKALASLLAEGGRILFSVPNWIQNAGDLLVADHVNHFTETSIRRLAADAGLVLEDIDADALPATFVVTCRIGLGVPPPAADVAREVEHARAVASALRRACDGLDKAFAANAGRRAAVYGAGFYGAFLLTRMKGELPIACCLDSNQHLWGKSLFGVPVQAPDSLPTDVERVYVGLNPARAKAIVANIPALQRDGLELVFMEV
jgi:SAM-dependent methyltransferase